MQTHIYVVVNPEGIRKCDRCGAYLITADGSDRNVFGMITTKTESVHGTTITTLAEALERFKKPCEIALHAKDAWVLNMIDRNLKTWEKADFRTADGKEIANREQWRRICAAIKDKQITIYSGKHEFYSWMTSEMVLSNSKHKKGGTI